MNQLHGGHRATVPFERMHQLRLLIGCLGLPLLALPTKSNLRGEGQLRAYQRGKRLRVILRLEVPLEDE